MTTEALDMLIYASKSFCTIWELSFMQIGILESHVLLYIYPLSLLSFIQLVAIFSLNNA